MFYFLLKFTSVKQDDLLETLKHFRSFDFILDTCDSDLSESYIRELHGLLKRNTTSEGNPLTPIASYKVLDNEVGRISTSQVESDMNLLVAYFESEQKFYKNYLQNKGFEGEVRTSKNKEKTV